MCCSLKSYPADIYQKDLGRLNFPNYHNFKNINDAYSKFIQKVMGVIDLVAPIKARQIKQNSQKRFHGKVAEKKSVRDKLLKKKKKIKT